jgi:large subunit ribosomal protein L17
MRNLARALIQHERITTTVDKAKALRPYIERMVTRARKDSVHSRRLVARDIHDRALVRRLFDEIAVRFADRPGGYTRILRLAPRRGDHADMAIIEFVDRRQEESGEDDKKKSSDKKKAGQGAG